MTNTLTQSFIDPRLDHYVYMVADDDGDEIIFAETKIPAEGDHSYAAAKSALDNATWTARRLYLVNFARCEIKDVSEITAIAIWNEVHDSGDPIEESIYIDFIREHVPASYDCGYRGPEPVTDDSAVYCPHPEIKAAE